MKVVQPSAYEEVDRLKNIGPKLAYGKALTLYFVTPSGTVCNVEDCTGDDFRLFINACKATVEPNAFKREITELDYTDLIDRWYALECYQYHQAIGLLFESKAEAIRRSEVKAS